MFLIHQAFLPSLLRDFRHLHKKRVYSSGLQSGDWNPPPLGGVMTSFQGGSKSWIQPSWNLTLGTFNDSSSHDIISRGSRSERGRGLKCTNTTGIEQGSTTFGGPRPGSLEDLFSMDRQGAAHVSQFTPGRCCGQLWAMVWGFRTPVIQGSPRRVAYL